ncbi:hypothetical protein C1645_741860 [Glomus cerebriforme]|uniref:Uncharacterized protein n=1 Tax=Glomus cerebriforme TaxID=658196 RepID=A0A397SQX5_9GLOM|nr:hypothetical protein C1645_741860 [Glomus cerebriforme]
MSSVTSNKSSNRTLKRVTRSQSASTNVESHKFSTNLETEKNIIDQTYGTTPHNNNTQLNVPNNKEIEPQPVITNSVPITDKDIVMANTEVFEISETSKSSSLPAITTTHNTLDNSMHASRKGKTVIKDIENTNSITANEFNTFYQTSTTNDHQQTSLNEPINSDFNDANKITTISDMEDIELDDQTNMYLSFALLQDFQFNSLYDLKTDIRRHFLNNPSLRN